MTTRKATPRRRPIVAATTPAPPDLAGDVAHAPTPVPADHAFPTRFAAAEASPGLVLWRVATLWQRRVRAALEPLGLTHAQFVLLAAAAWLEAHAAADAPPTQADIAGHARTDAVMTSEVLRTLERKKLLRRLPHPADARARAVRVTAAGRALVARAVPAVEAVDAAFFGAPEPDLRALAAVLGAPDSADRGAQSRV